MLSAGAVFAQTTISGRVTGAGDGEPLEGVAVLIKGTTIGMFTDADGFYQLDVPSDAQALVFSYVGKRTTEEPINGRSTINVSLVDDNLSLDEVVVTGYGAQSRKTITSSIVQVDGELVEDIATYSFENALQGRVAGVNITANSGTLGAGINVRVRGIASINADNQPLFVVDGVPLEGLTGQALGGPGTNPLVNINPNDIASFEVLKDAAATAIYGARGSNGVVIITTKSGRQGKPRVELNYYAGFSEPTATWDLLNGEQYAELWNRAGENLFADIGLTEEDWQDPSLHLAVFGADYRLTEGEQPYTNWIDSVTRRAFLQQFNASVSGGDENTTYFISGTYRDEEGYVKRTEFQRYAFRANLEQRINNRVKVGLSVAPTQTRNQRQNEDNNVASPFTYGALAFPNVPARDSAGELFFGPPENGLGQFAGRPIGNIEGQDIVLTTTQVLSRAFVDINLTSFLDLHGEISNAYTQLTEDTKSADYTTDGFPIGTGTAENELSMNTNFTTFLTYNQTFGEHGLKATLGATWQQYDRQQSFVSGNNFGDNRLQTLDNAAEITSGGGFGTNFSFQNNFFRVNYNYGGKYLLSAVASYNGSSRFGEESRYGFFPAVSAGWIISEENFLSGNSALSFLKVRASIGQTGNAEIGNFASRALASFNRPYGNQPGYELSSLGNPNLTWEVANQIDAALEFGLLNNRISGSIGYFVKTTSSLLFDAPQPLTTGIATSASQTASPNPQLPQNIGTVRNTGLEVDLKAEILRGDFGWTVGGNISTINNEVLELPDNDGDGEPDEIIIGRQIIREGDPIGAFYLVEYAGVDPNNGDALFVAREDEGAQDSTTSSYSLDYRTVSGSPFPDFFGGFTNTFTYKGIELTAFFTFSVGNDIYRNEARFVSTNMGATWNQTVDQLDAWETPGQETDVPQARLFTTNGSQHSTRYLEDASYLRLKTGTLAYNFPSSLLNGRTLRIFAQGQNLLTFTNFGGLDPEASGDVPGDALSGDVFFSRPQSRTITFGVNLGF